NDKQLLTFKTNKCVKMLDMRSCKYAFQINMKEKQSNNLDFSYQIDQRNYVFTESFYKDQNHKIRIFDLRKMEKQTNTSKCILEFQNQDMLIQSSCFSSHENKFITLPKI